MEIVADLHLHSKYSRAVSKQMDLKNMARWGEIKGIDLLGTGDFTHPLWFLELKNFLEEKDGILEMRSEKWEAGSGSEKCEVRFLLTTEISSIYKQGGKVRKIHNLIVAPSISTVEKINNELKKRGCNLSSDGRPIVGLSAKAVAEIVLSIDKNCLIIPAHIWTPWFSLFGANSGFDSTEECYGEFGKYIYAVETGLSSDPKMNWAVSDLDNRNIVSFSDAHSAKKLGRECTVFKIDTKILRYEDIRRALIGKWEAGSGKWDNESRSENSIDRTITLQDPVSHLTPHISYTIEFYPQEGKYHWTGHKKCGVIFSPEDTLKRGTTCPVCGKRLTIGVVERVRELGKAENQGVIREEDLLGVRWTKKDKRPCFVSLVPLAEIIAESFGMGEASIKVSEEYFKLVKKFGSEIEILMKRDLGEIGENESKKLAEGIGKVRKGDIFIRPGYDGEYGKVSVWSSESTPRNMEKKGDLEEYQKEQMSLF